MNGWQVFGVLIIVVIFLTILSGFKTWSNNKRIAQLDYIRLQEEISDNQKVADIAKINEKTIEGMIKIAAEATENMRRVLDCYLDD